MEDGVWRTVSGRRIFIKEGQSLSDAMKNSGKFENIKDVGVGEKKPIKYNTDISDGFKKTFEELHEEYGYLVGELEVNQGDNFVVGFANGTYNPAKNSINIESEETGLKSGELFRQGHITLETPNSVAMSYDDVIRHEYAHAIFKNQTKDFLKKVEEGIKKPDYTLAKSVSEMNRWERDYKRAVKNKGHKAQQMVVDKGIEAYVKSGGSKESKEFEKLMRPSNYSQTNSQELLAEQFVVYERKKRNNIPVTAYEKYVFEEFLRRKK